MKHILIATTTLALTTSIGFASQDVLPTEQFFRLNNESAAERVVPSTSTGDYLSAARKFAADNEAAAERKVLLPNEVNPHDEDAAKVIFSQSNDSAAEQNVHYH